MHRIKPTARRFENQCSVVWHAAKERRHRDGHCDSHSSRRTCASACSPRPQRRFTPGPRIQDPDGEAFWSLVAQASGQKREFVPNFSQPRRVVTKPLTTDAPLPVWGTKQGIGLSHRGDPGLAPPGHYLPPLRGLRRAVIAAIAVTRARRLTAPRFTSHAGDRGHRSDLGLADARHAAGPFGTPFILLRKVGRGFRGSFGSSGDTIHN